MDRRRRFAPSAEGLEGRQLLSAANLGTQAAIALREAQAARQVVPTEELIQIRLERIERLPRFLQSLDRDRNVPEEVVSRIQADLVSLVGQLRPPTEAVSNAFVEQLRATIPDATIDPVRAAQLNNAFGRVLLSAGAPEPVVESLKQSMLDLTRTDVFVSKPVVVLTNDYAVVLQTTLSVGRPLTRPRPGGGLGPGGVGPQGPAGAFGSVR
ncbi:hypothetical protein BH23PLA1_BH23PLA1_09820 [soil metagenome]